MILPTCLNSVAPTAATVSVFDEVLEDTLTARDMLRIILAATSGVGGPDGAGTYRYRDVMDVKDRIVADVDGTGYRTSVSRDAT